VVWTATINTTLFYFFFVSSYVNTDTHAVLVHIHAHDNYDMDVLKSITTIKKTIMFYKFE